MSFCAPFESNWRNGVGLNESFLAGGQQPCCPLAWTFKVVRQRRVMSSRIVLPDATEVLDDMRRPTLTLVTCYPFYYVGAARRRLVVQAEKFPRVSEVKINIQGVEMLSIYRRHFTELLPTTFRAERLLPELID
jgi:Sortase domain